jgi:hypothetical protein
MALTTIGNSVPQQKKSPLENAAMAMDIVGGIGGIANRVQDYRKSITDATGAQNTQLYNAFRGMNKDASVFGPASVERGKYLTGLVKGVK